MIIYGRGHFTTKKITKKYWAVENSGGEVVWLEFSALRVKKNVIFREKERFGELQGEKEEELVPRFKGKKRRRANFVALVSGIIWGYSRIMAWVMIWLLALWFMGLLEQPVIVIRHLIERIFTPHGEGYGSNGEIGPV